jgi:hypothetical protein
VEMFFDRPTGGSIFGHKRICSERIASDFSS